MRANSPSGMAWPEASSGVEKIMRSSSTQNGLLPTQRAETARPTGCG